MDALQGFPDFDTKLMTEKGMAICQKQDIFKGLMWFAYTENFANWHVLKIEQVKEILAENKLKNKVSSLEDYAVETVAEPEKDFNNAMGQESLTRFDQPKRKKKSSKNRRPNKEGQAAGANPNLIQASNPNQYKPSEPNPNQQSNNKPSNRRPNNNRNRNEPKK